MASGYMTETGRKCSMAGQRDAVVMGLCACAMLVVTGAHSAETNVAPYSEVRSTPYVGASIAYLTDGKVASRHDNTLMLGAPLPITAARMPLQYEFSFPTPVRITRVRLIQHDTTGRRPASGYVIELDTTGNRNYATKVVTEGHGRGGEWFTYSVSPPVTAYALRFRTTEFVAGPGPNYGAPAVEEFEIFTDSAVLAGASSQLPAARLLQPDPTSGKNIEAGLRNGAASERIGQFQRGIVGSMWLYWSAGQSYNEDNNAEKMSLLERLKVNRYWLYPGVYVPNRNDQPFLTFPTNTDYLHFIHRQRGTEDAAERPKQLRIAPFSSRVVPGYRENVLAPFVAQMHKARVRVIVNESLLPYGRTGWDFPRVIDPKVYPSVLSSSFVRDASTTLYREYMNAGSDGLALGGDEFFLYGPAGLDEGASPICKDANGATRNICRPTTNELFKERFGIDPEPARSSFSPLVAKWTVFKYEQLASLFSNYSRMTTAAKPDAIVTSLFRAGEENRPTFGVAYDVMGSAGGVAEMSSNPYWSHNSYLGHYYFANETKKLTGASRGRTAALMLQTTPKFDRNGYENPIMVYGPAFSALMHGARGINFYKQDYIFAGGTNDAGPWVERFFNLTAFLDRKGLAEFRAPKAVALLYSRASEDWWQMANAADPIASKEAILYQNAVIEALLRSGVPFDLYYLDQPTSLDAVGEYPVAIMPFPYSIADASVARIRAAQSRGTKVVSIQRAGEVDEFANPRRRAALDALPGLERWHIDLARSNYVEFSAQLMHKVLQSLGERLPFTFDSNGRDVECAIRERRNSRWVFCLNWEQRAVDVNIGVKMPAGDYAASVVTMQHEMSATVEGRTKLTAFDLRLLRVALAPGEARIVTITPFTEVTGAVN